MTSKAYDVITDKILDALKKGEVPWRKPWSLPAGIKPQSVSGHPYRGINALLLGLSGYTDPRWLTFRKAKELGGNVIRGQKASPVVLWKPITKEAEEGEDRTIWLLRYYSVFNAMQCEGLPLPAISTEAREFDPISEAEGIIANMPHSPSIDHGGGDRAYYVPALDSVHLPPRYAFDKAEEYYSTAFHELGHSTGHKSRLDRHGLETGIAAFGSQVYSKEELAAEFCSTFICNESGIENTLDNSTAYIQGWAKKLRSDKSMVIVAASQGQRAADFILGRGGEQA